VGIDAGTASQANGAGGKRGCPLQNGDRTLPIDQAGHELAFALGFGDLDLKPVRSPGGLQLDSGQFLVLSIDEQFLFVRESRNAGQIVMGQDGPEFIQVSLYFGKVLAGKLHFIFLGDGIEIGIAEEEIGELGQQPVFEFGKT
jgi:hypothetical protein